jgi:hypothetical protein
MKKTKRKEEDWVGRWKLALICSLHGSTGTESATLSDSATGDRKLIE